MPTPVKDTDTLDQKRLLKVLSDYRRGDFSVADARRSHRRGRQDLRRAERRRSSAATSWCASWSASATSSARRATSSSAPRCRTPRATWANAVEAVNTLVSDLVQPTTEVARVIGAVAKGDLSQSMALEIDGRPLTGEFLRTAKIVNTMVDQLGTFASEVTRVAREVGTEGKLGGQAIVKGVAGTWKDLTDNVNFMAANLTSQVRNIAEVTTAVAKGDLSKKITVDVKGEILELKNTVNTMVDQLSSFASEVTRVAQRSRHRRQAGRPGGSQRRGRHVEGPDRQRQPAGRQPDRAAARRVAGGDRDCRAAT